MNHLQCQKICRFTSRGVRSAALRPRDSCETFFFKAWNLAGAVSTPRNNKLLLNTQGLWAPARVLGPVLQTRCGVFSQMVNERSNLPGWPEEREEELKPTPPSAEHSTLGRVDYCSSNEDGVLALPLRKELTQEQLKNVFGFPDHLSKFYRLGQTVGSGSFGTVHRAVEHATKQVYAVKSIPKKPKKGKPTPRYLLKIQTEVEAMMQLGASLNAVFLKDVFEDANHVHLVMELCTGGALGDRFEFNEIVGIEITEQDIARQIRSILRFLSQCHSKGIIYRDVKPDNFLFLSTAEDSPLKATDFGLAIRHWPQEGNLKSRSGTPAYMAPEVIMQNYDEKCDLWSTGMVMYQLLFGKFPFWTDIRNHSLQEVWKSILVDKLDLNSTKVKRRMSAPALDLLKKLLERNPSKRIGAHDALNHPWIKELDTYPEMALGGTLVQRLQRFATYGRMKQMVLLTVTQELIARGRSKMLAELHDVFVGIDSKGVGYITHKDLLAMLQREGYLVTDDEVIQLVTRMDLNTNGAIDYEEMITALIDWDSMHSEESFGCAIDAAFLKLDTGAKGHIDVQDLLPLLPPYLEDAPDDVREHEARRMMREIDPTHHGHIIKPDFVAILMDSYGEDLLDQYDDASPTAAPAVAALSMLAPGARADPPRRHQPPHFCLGEKLKILAHSAPPVFSASLGHAANFPWWQALPPGGCIMYITPSPPSQLLMGEEVVGLRS
eukprot:CAMPEP_0177618164 /NCGR_PEP_ID=MMETSP0419_2-20121207/25380_1 /TAXON_ID=582737 /ORGANISM="Tetraselmis sp., Strain GSL018" /LENGTH=719 /DNA_ID=CAMNT_0019116945 /DNA_START=118 /DNA_END=2278 /DNA_ORIENTATION=-